MYVGIYGVDRHVGCGLPCVGTLNVYMSSVREMRGRSLEVRSLADQFGQGTERGRQVSVDPSVKSERLSSLAGAPPMGTVPYAFLLHGWTTAAHLRKVRGVILGHAASRIGN